MKKSDSLTDKRIKQILNLIVEFAAGNLGAKETPSDKNDELDGIISGLNMLGEDLQANVVSMDFLNKIFSMLNDFIVVVDFHYDIVMINQSALQILGYTEKELLGNPSRMIFAENILDNFTKFHQSDQKYYYKEEITFFTSKNERIQVELTVIPFEVMSEDKSGFLCVGYNLQEKKEAMNIKQLHDKVVRYMMEGICLISEETGKIFYTNVRLDEMFGYEHGELLKNSKTLEPFPQFAHRAVNEDIGYCLAKHGFWSGEACYLKKDGTQIWCRTSITTFKHENFGTVWLIMHTDITLLKEIEFQLKELSLTDSLTGLRNRRALEEKIYEEWNRGLRGKYSLGIIMIDVDYFKAYNDHYGHTAGDKILKMISEVLKKSAKRAGDMAVRFGGEEFIIVLPMTERAETIHIAENIRHEIELKNKSHAFSHFEKITISCGVSSLIPSSETSPEELLNLSDAALYMAKESGRNKVVSL